MLRQHQPRNWISSWKDTVWPVNPKVATLIDNRIVIKLCNVVALWLVTAAITSCVSLLHGKECSHDKQWSFNATKLRCSLNGYIFSISITNGCTFPAGSIGSSRRSLTTIFLFPRWNLSLFQGMWIHVFFFHYNGSWIFSPWLEKNTVQLMPLIASILMSSS